MTSSRAIGDMSPPSAPLDELLTALARGAARHATCDAAARSRLALACARSVAAAAAEWVRVAVAIKDGGPAAWAEETATGPLATLRLLLLTAGSLEHVARHGLPWLPKRPRDAAPAERGGAGASSLVEVDVLPARGLHDTLIFAGQRATVRCAIPGGVAAFAASWRREVEERQRAGGVAVVLGAGNVTGLVAADALCQIFEHGRAALLKLHPLHAPLEPVLLRALDPLVDAGLLAIVVGDAEMARVAVASPHVTHVHLTGGSAAFAALVWGGRDPHAPGAVPALSKSITCELGSVTPWFVVPGRYTPAQLASQADTVAASIANNTSFNCIATKLVVTCRSWPQRAAFLDLVGRRLASLPPRPAWYPGSAALWETITAAAAPADGSLPWVFRTGIDLVHEREWVAREWFVPVAAETAVEADGMEEFCVRAAALARGLPGSLAASVTIPDSLTPRDLRRAELLAGHLEYGVVAINGWSAMAYAAGNVPWGGFPGATLAAPDSGIGRVHDPLLLPLVHNSILRMPLVVRPAAPWFPWHPGGRRLTEGLLATYAAIARGGPGIVPVLRMLPEAAKWVLRALPPP